jgi:tetratricopeptide (TPR) repeat protein/tRNA A-37 threonylcarbamoyl transferase component Bud32
MFDSAGWFADPEMLVCELRQGEFAPRRAPVLDGFDDLHEVGRGGQAVVYAGMQRSTKRRAAVKVLLDGAFASVTDRRRFEREIELIASLRHPHIVQVYDSGCSADGHPFCVMEYIEGVPLDEFWAGLRQARQGEEHFTDVLRQFALICEAVNYAHQRGVIHRDLKPGNIRVDRDGQPHILDFGLAKTAPTGRDVSKTGMSVPGQFVGSLVWASPEQARGEALHLDIRSDVYSLGVILYQGLTLHFPYEVTGDLHAVLDSIVKREPFRPRAVNRVIDEELETILLRCLAKEPARRYQTAGELAADIRRYLAGEAILAKGDSGWYMVRKMMRRHRTAVLVAALFTAATVVFGITMAFMYGRAARAEAIARQEVDRAGAVNTFLENMLASANPDQLGRDVTVRAVLDEAAKDIDRGLYTEPMVRASLHAVIGTTYRGLGDFAKAHAHLESALALFRRQLGENAVRTLETENALADVQIDRNALDEAEPLIQATLTRARTTLGEDHRIRLHAESGVARLRSNQSRWAEAQALFEPLVERMSRALGPHDEQTLATTNNLAHVLHAQGRYADAEATHRRVLDARAQRYGREHPSVLTSMGNIAAALNSLGKLADAEAMLREQIATGERVWGPEHRSTLAARLNLAFNVRQQGRREEALTIIQEILPIQKRVLGAEHGDSISAMNTLAALYSETQRHGDAERVAREAYETCKRAHGERDVNTLTAMHNLGSALTHTGRLEEAEQLYTKNLELCREIYAPDHPELAWPMNQLAGIWVRQRKHDDAATLFADAIRIVRKGLPADHYFLPWLLYNRGCGLREAGRYAESETDLLECYRLYRDKGGDGHSDTQYAIRALIKLYEAWSKPEQVERFRPLLEAPVATTTTSDS